MFKHSSQKVKVLRKHGWPNLVNKFLILGNNKSSLRDYITLFIPVIVAHIL